MNIRRLGIVVLAGFMLASSVGAEVVSSKVTVTTAATLLASATFTDGRKHVEVSHACVASIYVGGSGVTTAAGRELAAATSLSMTLAGGESLYAIVASSTCSVTVLRSGGSS